MKKVLIVDDNALNLDLAEQILEDDYAIITATNGQEALDAVEVATPDVVLMDLSMPVMDGWTAIAKLRERKGASLPIIALSAHAVPAEIQRAYDAGCDDFVTKPIDDDELFAKLEKLLA